MIEGVIRTRVGYAGGTSSFPSYHNLGDHTETVQIDYDPERITYSQLLNVFWDSHQPAEQSRSPQYKNIIFTGSKSQHLLAISSRSALEEKIGRHVKTDIKHLGSFTIAEDYHQKYLLRHSSLEKEITRLFPDPQKLVWSTAAAKLNGYAGGYGSRELLSQQIDTLGLSDKGKELLTDLVARQY